MNRSVQFVLWACLILALFSSISPAEADAWVKSGTAVGLPIDVEGSISPQTLCACKSQSFFIKLKVRPVATKDLYPFSLTFTMNKDVCPQLRQEGEPIAFDKTFTAPFIALAANKLTITGAEICHIFLTTCLNSPFTAPVGLYSKDTQAAPASSGTIAVTKPGAKPPSEKKKAVNEYLAEINPTELGATVEQSKFKNVQNLQSVFKVRQNRNCPKLGDLEWTATISQLCVTPSQTPEAAEKRTTTAAAVPSAEEQKGETGPSPAAPATAGPPANPGKLFLEHSSPIRRLRKNRKHFNEADSTVDEFDVEASA